MLSVQAMLIDEFLSDYDYDERHSVEVAASSDAIYRAAKQVDFSDSFIVRSLMRLRGMETGRLTLEDFSYSRFKVLGEIPGKELLIGLAGRFWTPWGDLQEVDASNFHEFDKAGYAKAVWNFSVSGDGVISQLTTETRIKCLDTSSRRRFGFYWTLIRPFSGLIRMEMLSLIKRSAEAAHRRRCD